MQADALGRAEKLDREIESRRAEMFGDLEKQRDELTASVAALRSFEATYRSNLTGHLRSQIETLESGRAEPADAPEVVRDQPPSNGASSGPTATAGIGERNGGGQHPVTGTMRRPWAAAARPATRRGWTPCSATSAERAPQFDPTGPARSAGPVVVRCPVPTQRANSVQNRRRVVEETHPSTYGLCDTSVTDQLGEMGIE